MKRTRAEEGHPPEDTLLRFLRGEASRRERRAVVRHLLTGCPECVAVTRPAWKLMESTAKRGEPMADEVTAAHTELLLIIQDVETLRYRLLGVRASLPEREDAGATELRVRLRHIVGDRLHSLLEDLTAAAEYPSRDPRASF